MTFNFEQKVKNFALSYLCDEDIFLLKNNLILFLFTTEMLTYRVRGQEMLKKYYFVLICTDCIKLLGTLSIRQKYCTSRFGSFWVNNVITRYQITEQAS